MKVRKFTKCVDGFEDLPIEGIVKSQKTDKDGKPRGNVRIKPRCIVFRPQNLFDDGTLSDHPDPFTKPVAVIEWMEFDSPIVEEWPPQHRQTDFL